MRIFLDNSGYELLNVGDTAMLQVAASRLLRQWPGAQLHVLTWSPRRLAACCPGAIPISPQGKRVWMQPRNIFGPTHHFIPNFAEPLLSHLETWTRRTFPAAARRVIDSRLTQRGADVPAMHRYIQTLLDSDLVLATGGGFLTDTFESHALGVIETLAIAQAAGIPTALLGQGIGPIQSRSLRRAIRNVLRRARLVAVREGTLGPRILQDFRLPPDRIAVTGDDAIELAYDARPADLGNAIGINLRLASYAGIGESRLAAVLTALHTAASELGAPLAPLPVSYYEDGEDARAAADLIADYPHSYPVPTDLITPSDLIERVAACRVVVTGSYHAGVFALAQGIPVVALAESPYYLAKFTGLADLFPGGVQMVVLAQPNLDRALTAAIHQQWHAADATRPALLAAASRQLDAGRRAFSRLADLVAESDDGPTPWPATPAPVRTVPST